VGQPLFDTFLITPTILGRKMREIARDLEYDERRGWQNHRKHKAQLAGMAGRSVV
jgi:hypothetical protein